MALTTGKVRASYVNVFQPRTPENGGEPKYSVTLLISKSDAATINAIYAEIEKAKQEGAQRVFGGAVPPMCKIPIYDGDGYRPSSGEPFGEECKGHMVMTASAKLQPSVVGLDMQPIINPADVYSGCYIRANINFFAYSANGNKGIGCGLNAIQKIEDGEALTSRVSAEEAFGGTNAYNGAVGTYNTVPQMPPVTQGYMSAGQQGYAPTVQQTHSYPQMQTQMYQQASYAPPVQGQQIDPITGRPALNGGVMGIG